MEQREIVRLFSKKDHDSLSGWIAAGVDDALFDQLRNIIGGLRAMEASHDVVVVFARWLRMLSYWRDLLERVGTDAHAVVVPPLKTKYSYRYAFERRKIIARMAASMAQNSLNV